MTSERKKFKFGMTEPEYKVCREQGIAEETMKFVHDFCEAVGEDAVARLLGRQYEIRRRGLLYDVYCYGERCAGGFFSKRRAQDWIRRHHLEQSSL